MMRPLQEFKYSLQSAAELLRAEVFNSKDIEFTGIAYKDSEVQPGDLFLAFPGAKVHGAQFIDAAIKAGAVAVLTDSIGASMSKTLPTLVVSTPREAGAILAASFYRDPTRTMSSIGITGTNGKTTVTTLLYQIFTAMERQTGLIGTVETRIGSERIASERTTPEAADLQSLAASMVERHMRHLVMEVSSHALDLKRLVGTHFEIVGFTNLSQDHLDFHHDMESYFAAKAKLFTHEYAETGFINIDNEYGARLLDIAQIPVATLSRTNKKAQWHYTEIHPIAQGVEFTMRGRDGVLIQSRTPMHGGFNLDNLLMAVAIAYELGADPLQLAAIIPNIAGAPGRLEAVELGQKFKALVDYAHSPDAVVNVLAATREFTQGRVIAILGCGGDRDATKRPLMGSALAQGADVAIFTSDNPRSEPPSEILKEMVAAVTVTEPSRIIEDRKAAIDYAISIAQAGDTVILLGKGHESGQEINGQKFAFDDRLVLAESIEAKR
jgi:UDP-N-acetylmuramoyl-L-alanyl-D-glutamate--2,6-diaminopimelate ligase